MSRPLFQMPRFGRRQKPQEDKKISFEDAKEFFFDLNASTETELDDFLKKAVQENLNALLEQAGLNFNQINSQNLTVDDDRVLRAESDQETIKKMIESVKKTNNLEEIKSVLGLNIEDVEKRTKNILYVASAVGINDGEQVSIENNRLRASSISSSENEEADEKKANIDFADRLDQLVDQGKEEASERIKPDEPSVVDDSNPVSETPVEIEEEFLKSARKTIANARASVSNAVQSTKASFDEAQSVKDADAFKAAQQFLLIHGDPQHKPQPDKKEIVKNLNVVINYLSKNNAQTWSQQLTTVREQVQNSQTIENWPELATAAMGNIVSAVSEAAEQGRVIENIIIPMKTLDNAKKEPNAEEIDAIRYFSNLTVEKIQDISKKHASLQENRSDNIEKKEDQNVEEDKSIEIFNKNLDIMAPDSDSAVKLKKGIIKANVFESMSSAKERASCAEQAKVAINEVVSEKYGLAGLTQQVPDHLMIVNAASVKAPEPPPKTEKTAFFSSLPALRRPTMPEIRMPSLPSIKRPSLTNVFSRGEAEQEEFDISTNDYLKILIQSVKNLQSMRNSMNVTPFGIAKDKIGDGGLNDLLKLSEKLASFQGAGNLSYQEENALLKILEKYEYEMKNEATEPFVTLKELLVTDSVSKDRGNEEKKKDFPLTADHVSMLRQVACDQLEREKNKIVQQAQSNAKKNFVDNQKGNIEKLQNTALKNLHEDHFGAGTAPQTPAGKEARYVQVTHVAEDGCFVLKDGKSKDNEAFKSAFDQHFEDLEKKSQFKIEKFGPVGKQTWRGVHSFEFQVNGETHTAKVTNDKPRQMDVFKGGNGQNLEAIHDDRLKDICKGHAMGQIMKTVNTELQNKKNGKEAVVQAQGIYTPNKKSEDKGKIPIQHVIGKYKQDQSGIDKVKQEVNQTMPSPKKRH